jgi:hypothetical protein
VSGGSNEVIYEKTENALFDEYGQTDPFVEEEEKLEYDTQGEGPNTKPKLPEFVTEGISTHDHASLQTDPIPMMRIRLDDIAVQSAPSPPELIEKQVQADLEEEDSTSTFYSSSDESLSAVVSGQNRKNGVKIERISIPSLVKSDEEFSSTSEDIDFMVSDGD